MSPVSVADRSVAVPGSVRRIPMTIRLSQPLLVQLIEYLKSQRQVPESWESGGVLYGRFSAGQLTLVSFRAFTSIKGTAAMETAGITSREQALIECLALNKGDPELSDLKAVGWFALRSNEGRGLTAGDVEIHHRRFRRVSDVALILRIDQQANVRTDFYSKSPYAPFSQRKHRFGALRLSLNEAPTEAVDIKMKPIAQRAAMPVVLSRMPGVGYQPGTPRISYTTGPVLVRAFNKPYPKSRLFTFGRSLTTAQRLVITAAGIFVLTAGLSFGSIFLRTPGQEQLPDRFPPGPGFAMQVRPEGDSLLLTWNGGLARAYKADGVMLIDDAAQHREVRLDPDELATGALLYRPASNDILFRLRLSDDRGKTLTDSLRRVDARRVGEDPAREKPVQQATVSPAPTPAPAAAPSHLSPKNGTSRAHGNVPASNRAPATPKLRVMSAPKTSEPAPIHLAPQIASSQPALPLGSDRTPIEIASLAPPESMYLERHIAATVRPQLQLSGDASPASVDPKPAAPQFEAPPSFSSPNFSPNPSPAAMGEPDIPQHARQPGVTPYVVARLHTKVMPDAKILAYSVQDDVTLQFEVHIDEEGRVTKVRLVHHSGGVNAEIEGASIAAVKQWTFEPAKSYGSEVASNYMVVLHFAPAPRQ